MNSLCCALNGMLMVQAIFQTNAQADPSLRSAYMPFCLFGHDADGMVYKEI